MSRTELAAASWAHLRACRDAARAAVPPTLDGDLAAVGQAVAASGRRLAVADTALPGRLIAGNIGAALAGCALAAQSDLVVASPAAGAAHTEQAMRALLVGAGPAVEAVIAVEHVEVGDQRAVYYRRRNCCLRDRLAGQHRCDTCSLRPAGELVAMVERAVERRRAGGDASG